MTLYFSLFYFYFFIFKYLKHRCEPSSKLRLPLSRADRTLLRMWGRTLSVYADMPTMNIQISLKFHAVCAASKVLQNYNDLGLKELANLGSCQNKCLKKSNIGTHTLTIPTQNIQNQ